MQMVLPLPAVHASSSPHAIRSSRAFTLVEMAIVLVIIGLLTGGVLAGRGMVRGAEMKTLMVDAVRYEKMFQKFQTKFMSLPGDLPIATRLWGRADSPADYTGADCGPMVEYTTAGVGEATCNGDGNGVVTGIVAPSPFDETYRVWEHLQSSGLMEGDLTGIKDPTSVLDYGSLPGVNVPRISFKNSGVSLRYAASAGAQSQSRWENMAYNHHFVVGKLVNNWTDGAILTPKELSAIDRKFDDGSAVDGKIVAPAVATCVTTLVKGTTAYLLTSDAISCAFVYLLGM